MTRPEGPGCWLQDVNANIVGGSHPSRPGPPPPGAAGRSTARLPRGGTGPSYDGDADDQRTAPERRLL